MTDKYITLSTKQCLKEKSKVQITINNAKKKICEHSRKLDLKCVCGSGVNLRRYP